MAILKFAAPILALASLVAAASCGHDNCLRAYLGKDGGPNAYSFCQTFTTASVTATTALPKFVSQCTGSVVSRASSACTCFMGLYTTPSAISSVITTKSSSSSPSSSSSSSSSTAPPKSTCTPELTLVGASETAFNPAGVAFSLKLTCNLLNTQNYSVWAKSSSSNDAFGSLVTGTNISSTSIQIPGLGSGKTTISVFALDTAGNAILQTFSLLFGSINMPVSVLDAAGKPVSGALVTADATVYPGIQQNATTDSTGTAHFTNLASTTIGLLVRTADNAVGVNGVAATSSLVTINMLAFKPVSNSTDFNVSNGTTGWTGGVNEDLLITKRDTVLVVSTNGQYSLQMASSRPKIYPFTKAVQIKYKFQTNEVPGGYFGSQFNDYYVVVVRTDAGDYQAVTHSMNELGIGAFDSSGATNWYTLTIPTSPNAKWAEFDVGVSNVADNLLDSQVIVDKLGDLTCDQCGSCDTCPGDPMCQPNCQSPPPQSCDFYANCAEETLKCGSDGYPLAYGQNFCLRFQENRNSFSLAGQSFIWNTMHCLQVALVNNIQCDSTCSSVSDAAFASHPLCYVQAGVCTLPPMDLFELFLTVKSGLFGVKQGIQVIQTGIGCGGVYLSAIDTEISNLLEQAKQDVVNAALYLAKAAALSIFSKLIQDVKNNLYPLPSI